MPYRMKANLSQNSGGGQVRASSTKGSILLSFCGGDMPVLSKGSPRFAFHCERIEWSNVHTNVYSFATPQEAGGLPEGHTWLLCPSWHSNRGTRTIAFHWQILAAGELQWQRLEFQPDPQEINLMWNPCAQWSIPVWEFSNTASGQPFNLWSRVACYDKYVEWWDFH